MRIPALPFGLSLALAACVSRPEAPVPSTAALEDQGSGTTELLQAVSIVDPDVVWVGGHGGTWARTVDGGVSWETARVPGAGTLQFRDVHALDARTAWLLSAGPGRQSRVYRTDDGGARWVLQWTNPETAGFYDCMDFWDAERGIVYGDAVEGSLRILRTEDGGAGWQLVDPGSLPAAQPGEGGFAASGTCAVTRPGGLAWIATGNAARARVFRTEDHGLSWTVADAPVIGGAAAGLTSLSMMDDRNGTAFGGNLAVNEERTDNLARTTDGGATWRPLPPLAMVGPAYGGVHVPGTGGRALLAVGPGGLDLSLDGGVTWRTLDPRAWWGVGSVGPSATWVAGPQGRIARVRLGSGP